MVSERATRLRPRVGLAADARRRRMRRKLPARALHSDATQARHAESGVSAIPLFWCERRRGMQGDLKDSAKEVGTLQFSPPPRITSPYHT